MTTTANSQSPAAQILFDESEPMADELLELLERVELHEGGEDPAIAVLRFRLRQQQTGDFYPIDERELLTPGRRVTLLLAVAGRPMQPMFCGHISHLRPHFEALEANCYLEVAIADPGALLDIADTVREFPDATDAEAAAEIFSEWNIPAEVHDTDTRHLVQDHALIQRGSDRQFLAMLARRNGYVVDFDVDPNTHGPRAYFGPPRYDADPQADLLATTEQANLEWLDAQLALLQPTRYRGHAIAALIKRAIRDHDQPATTELGGEPIAGYLESHLAGYGVESTARTLRTPSSTEAELAAQAEAASRATRFALAARGELDTASYGGLLRAHAPVLVRAAGQLLGGTYWVQRVHTTLAGGALRQRFELRRDAIELRGTEEFGRVPEEVGQ